MDSDRSAALSAEPHRVDLWTVASADVSDHLVSAYRALLSDDELVRERRFYFERDRRTHVIARALVRVVLSRYARIAPGDWRFAVTEYGRPVIDADQLVEAPLSFNLSHTQGLIAIAVRRTLAIGVDVECMTPRDVELDLADRFFAPEEARALRELPTACQPKRFFEYWTLKESYIKARGAGLSIPLAEFAFRLTSEATLDFSISDRLADVPSRWRLWQMQPTADHVLALCAERADVLETLTIRECVPLAMERHVTYALLRSSAPGTSL